MPLHRCTAAILARLLRTAPAAGAEPVTYFRDALVRIDRERDLDTLLPYPWKEQFADEVAQRREAAMRELSIAR